MKRNFLKIGLDFDGVIADTLKVKHMLAKKIYNIEIESDRFKEYMVIEDGKMSHREYRYLMNNVCGNMKYGLEMEEIQDSVSHVKDFLSSGCEVKIITSREGGEVDVAQEWCRLRGLEVDIVSVGYRGDKVKSAIGLDIYLDDDIPKLEPLIGIVKNNFLFSNIHNQGHEYHGDIVKVNSWKEFKDKVKELLINYGG